MRPASYQPARRGTAPVASFVDAESASYSRANQRYATRARKRGPWRVVFWLALVVLVVSLGALAYIGFTYWNGQRAYDSIAEENLTVPADPAGATLADFSVDWDALRAINPDIVGWIYVPGTSVNYPIVHRDGDDSYYLNHTFGGDTTGQFGAEFGCIMLSGVNNADLTDDVNVVYGHNMANGSMFAQFASFTDTATFNDHRTIYVLTPQGNFRLTTFAVDRIAGTDTTIVVPTQTADQLAEYAQRLLDASLVKPDPDVPDASSMSQIFAFSTCDNADDAYRFITFAYVSEYLPAGATESLAGSNALGANAGAGDSASGDSAGASSGDPAGADASGGSSADANANASDDALASGSTLVNPDDISDISSMAEERAS